MRKAVFLDRDGVLNRAVVRAGLPYPPSSVSEFELYADAFSGCARLKQGGYVLIVVTNQPDIGRGTQSAAVVEAMHRKLMTSLPSLDRIEVCPHAGSRFGEPCECRKPHPGMLRRAAQDLAVDLSSSYLIGDRWRDIECARSAGCKSIFIDHQYLEQLRGQPDFVATSFAEAVDIVLNDTSG